MHWAGSAKRDLQRFPAVVGHDVGAALSAAQFGDRAAYTVRDKVAIYVSYRFQQKSPSGVRTAKRDIELIAKRLRDALEHQERHYGEAAS